MLSKRVCALRFELLKWVVKKEVGSFRFLCGILAVKSRINNARSLARGGVNWLRFNVKLEILFSSSLGFNCSQSFFIEWGYERGMCEDLKRAVLL